jgi:hypothetical protein
LGDLVSEEERAIVFALEALPIPSLPDGSPTASLEGEALLEVEILYDEITSDGVTSTKEQRTIRVLAVQSEADVKVNETAIKWVAQLKCRTPTSKNRLIFSRALAGSLSPGYSPARNLRGIWPFLPWLQHDVVIDSYIGNNIEHADDHWRFLLLKGTAPTAIAACCYFAGLLLGALEGRSKEQLLSSFFYPGLDRRKAHQRTVPGSEWVR